MLGGSLPHWDLAVVLIGYGFRVWLVGRWLRVFLWFGACGVFDYERSGVCRDGWRFFVLCLE